MLPSNIIKCRSFDYIYTFILYHIYIQNIPLIFVTLFQTDQNMFMFMFNKPEYAVYTGSTQATK